MNSRYNQKKEMRGNGAVLPWLEMKLPEETLRDQPRPTEPATIDIETSGEILWPRAAKSLLT